MINQMNVFGSNDFFFLIYKNTGSHFDTNAMINKISRYMDFC